jgi:hypothetical protein
LSGKERKKAASAFVNSGSCRLPAVAVRARRLE